MMRLALLFAALVVVVHAAGCCFCPSSNANNDGQTADSPEKEAPQEVRFIPGPLRQ